MSAISRQIRSHMKNLWLEGDTVCSVFEFPAGFIGFRGHFPRRPVLPGVCKVQAVIATLEAFSGKKYQLRELKLAKFFAPVSAGQEILVRCIQKNQEENLVDITATISSGEKKIAQINLKTLISHAT